MGGIGTEECFYVVYDVDDLANCRHFVEQQHTVVDWCWSWGGNQPTIVIFHDSQQRSTCADQCIGTHHHQSCYDDHDDGKCEQTHLGCRTLLRQQFVIHVCGLLGHHHRRRRCVGGGRGSVFDIGQD
jgi:hypothetical protein